MMATFVKANYSHYQSDESSEQRCVCVSMCVCVGVSVYVCTCVSVHVCTCVHVMWYFAVTQ